jgi:hypothetical protein
MSLKLGACAAAWFADRAAIIVAITLAAAPIVNSSFFIA